MKGIGREVPQPSLVLASLPSYPLTSSSTTMPAHRLTEPLYNVARHNTARRSAAPYPAWVDVRSRAEEGTPGGFPDLYIRFIPSISVHDRLN